MTAADESASDIQTITLSMPYRLGTVNCYLLKTRDGFALVDTGSSNRRTELECELARAGCQLGDLKLIALTHGDFDHTGNAAYLREVRRQDRHASRRYRDGRVWRHVLESIFW